MLSNLKKKIGFFRKSHKEASLPNNEQKIFLEWFSKELSKSYSSIVLCGLNEYTAELISLLNNKPNSKVTAVIDNSSKNISINSVPIIKTNNLSSIPTDVIVVLDNKNTTVLHKIILKNNDLQKPIIKLYADYLPKYLDFVYKKNSSKIPTKQSYILCTVRRSGSILLSSFLRSTNQLGKPHLHFGKLLKLRQNVSSDFNTIDFLNMITSFTTTDNGLFGTKMDWRTYSYFETLLSATDRFHNLKGTKLVSAALPNTKYVFLTRRNKFRRAISFYRARQTNTWCLTGNMSKYKNKEIKYDFKSLLKVLNNLEFEEQSWVQFFKDNNIEPLVIVYEDFVKNFETTIRSIYTFLDIKIPKNFSLEKPKYKKLADKLSDEWYLRFSQDYKVRCEK